MLHHGGKRAHVLRRFVRTSGGSHALPSGRQAARPRQARASARARPALTAPAPVRCGRPVDARRRVRGGAARARHVLPPAEALHAAGHAAAAAALPGRSAGPPCCGRAGPQGGLFLYLFLRRNSPGGRWARGPLRPLLRAHARAQAFAAHGALCGALSAASCLPFVVAAAARCLFLMRLGVQRRQSLLPGRLAPLVWYCVSGGCGACAGALRYWARSGHVGGRAASDAPEARGGLAQGWCTTPRLLLAGAALRRSTCRPGLNQAAGAQRPPRTAARTTAAGATTSCWRAWMRSYCQVRRA